MSNSIARGNAGLDARAEQRLRWLMFARLGLALVSFGIAIAMDGLGRSLDPQAREGLYWTLGAVFFATVVSGIWFPRVRNPQRFAAVQLALDVILVTGLVHFSGGRESVLTFLYVCVTVYGAVLFGRSGAFGAASLSALAYGGMLLATNAGWLSPSTQIEGVSIPVLVTIWGVHVGALFLVGALASMLSGDLHRAGAVLSQRTDALYRLRDVHQRTIESLMSGLLTTDRDMRVTSFNPESERITGAVAADVIGLEVDAVIPGVRSVLHEAAPGPADRAPARARLRYQNPAGEELHLGLAGSPLKDVGGHSCGHVLIFQDVTRVVAMEAELRRSERLAAVGEMGAKIAHEIRNPLAAISGSIEILRDEIGGGTEAAPGAVDPKRLMGIVLRETERLNSLITDFLAYSRPGPSRREAVALEPLFEELREMFEKVRPGSVELHCSVDGPLAADADPGQLRQILWNLGLNAMQAMPGGGRLDLEAHRLSEEAQDGFECRRNATDGTGPAPEPVEILVRDTGEGISPEAQERMFEPFFTTKREGTGLGLATVHRIVESHGGSLEIDSELSRGTEIRVRMPVGEGDA